MLIDHDTIILSRTEDGLSLRRLAACANVAFFWCVMLYLLRSLLLSLAAGLRALFFGETALELLDAETGRVFLSYLGLIVAASGALWTWANYNRRRYGGRHDKRRVHPGALTLAELGAYTGFSVAKLLQMRRSKVLVAHFDEAREPSEMDCYASVKEKEALDAAGLPAFRERSVDLSMFQTGPLAFDVGVEDPFGDPEEVGGVVYYLDPNDSGLLSILDVEAVEPELVG